MCKQCLRKKEAKKSHIWHKMSSSQIFLIHHRMPKFSWSIFLHPRSLYENVIETLIQAVIGVIKGKEPRCITHFQCPTKSYSPYWVRIMGFSSFFLTLWSRDLLHFFLKKYWWNSERQRCLKHKFIHFMQMLTLKQSLHISKVHPQMKTFVIKRKTKTAPSWSFILMLLMIIDQFSEFDRICIDQGLDLVLEGRAILCGMPSNSSVVLTSGINIISFRIWRSPRPCGNGRNPIILN